MNTYDLFFENPNLIKICNYLDTAKETVLDGLRKELAGHGRLTRLPDSRMRHVEFAFDTFADVTKQFANDYSQAMESALMEVLAEHNISNDVRRKVMNRMQEETANFNPHITLEVSRHDVVKGKLQEVAHETIEVGTNAKAFREDSFIPDATITEQEMKEFGYDWGGVHPLRKDKALELYEKGFEVILLYDDNSEAVAEDIEDIQMHDGIFGVSKRDWTLFYEERMGYDYPDRNIDRNEMNEYGYYGNDCFPIRSKDKAVMLHRHGLRIFKLSPDSTKEPALNSDDIQDFQGIFGIIKEDWETHINMIHPDRETCLDEVLDSEYQQESEKLFKQTFPETRQSAIIEAIVMTQTELEQLLEENQKEMERLNQLNRALMETSHFTEKSFKEMETATKTNLGSREGFPCQNPKKMKAVSGHDER